jgi:hypothetical protein
MKMAIKDVKYVLNVSNGEFTIFLNDNWIVKYTHYNNDTVTIGTDEHGDIVFISIYGFREYASNLIDEYIKKAVTSLVK